MKSATVLGQTFSCKQVKQLYLKFYLGKDILPIYRTIPKMLHFLGFVTVFKCTPISHSFGALHDTKDGWFPRMSSLFLVRTTPVDRFFETYQRSWHYAAWQM
jgi:hypothetical protein